MIKGSGFYPKHEICIVITHACNLRCKYCYYDKNNDHTHPDVELLKSRVAEEIGNLDGARAVEVVFHGGEPFLEWDAMREIAEWTWSRYPAVVFRATTNGTVLTEAMKDWLRAHRNSFLVTLSLDGLKSVHDRQRCNSFDLIDRNFFLSTYPQLGVKMTVSPETLPFMYDGFAFLSDLGFYMNPSLAREVDWDPTRDIPIYRKEVEKISKWYLAHPDVPPGELLGPNFVEQPLREGELCVCGCGAGRNLVAYDYDGTKYPCHSFIDFQAKTADSKLRELFTLLSKNDATVLESPCAKCLFAPWCAPCYGLSFVKRGAMGALDPVMCRFAAVTMRAAAELQAQMLVSDTPYVFMQRKTDNERACIARSVMAILEREDDVLGKGGENNEGHS